MRSLLGIGIIFLAAGPSCPPPNPTPTPTPTPPPTTTTTTTTSTTTTTTTTTTVPPEPPPGNVLWKETEQGGPDICGSATPRHLEAVKNAQALVLLVPGEGELSYYTRLCNEALRPVYDCAMYAEELAVAKASALSENYDLILASGASRPAHYASTCTPATRSAEIPTTTPPPSGGATYPAPVHRITIRNYSQPQPGHYVIDATALSCGPNEDFPGRQCWPACGPEGEHPPGCDEGLNPKWQGSGEVWSNVWQYHTTKGSRVRVCSGGVCSDWITAE